MNCSFITMHIVSEVIKDQLFVYFILITFYFLWCSILDLVVRTHAKSVHGNKRLWNNAFYVYVSANMLTFMATNFCRKYKESLNLQVMGFHFLCWFFWKSTIHTTHIIHIKYLFVVVSPRSFICDSTLVHSMHNMNNLIYILVSNLDTKDRMNNTIVLVPIQT